jgi:ring-1,2-phenylacetyl-CoA epoxidase subunit PaaE
MLRFHSLRVAQVQMQAEDAVAVALEVPAELAAEYDGLPGQHVVLRATLDGEEVRRTYSLVSAPGERLLRIVARVHEAGRLSGHLAQHTRPGDRLEVLPPNGSFTPRAAAAGGTCVAFAAGCGITPLVAIARRWLEAGPTGRVILFYGNRSMARAMCLEELLALKDRHLDRLSLHFVMSREPQETEIYNGRLDGEHVRELARSFFVPETVAECFICGPGDMIDTVAHALRGLGVGADRIRAEHFTVATAGPAAAAAAPVAPQTPAGGAPPGVAEVTVIMDGRRRSFAMRMHGESVLDGAARAGIELPFSCRAGVCSTCRTKVVSGEVRMEQNYALEEWELEQGYVLACQSKVATRELELDYDER